MGDREDESLVRRALSGGPQARRALVERLVEPIQREVAFALRHHAGDSGRDPRQDMHDLVQEVFIVLFEHDGRELRRWDPQRGRQLDSFVRLLARRKVARVLGQRRGNPWADLPIDPEVAAHDSDEAGIVRQLEERDELGVVLKALYATMSPRDIELFELLFVEQRDPAEVAERLGASRGAINAWSYRMRKQARAFAKLRIHPSPVARAKLRSLS